MVDNNKASYVKFLSTQPGPNLSNQVADQKATYYISKGIHLHHLQEAYLFFNTMPGPNKNRDESLALVEKYAAFSPAYIKDLYIFFNTNPGPNKNRDQALGLVDQWAFHRLGTIPFRPFTETLYKFFNTMPGPNKNTEESLALVLRFYEMTEVNGWLPGYDELILDVPKFYQFFNTMPGPNKNRDQSLALCEKIVKGVGRVNFEAFRAAYLNANKQKNADVSLQEAFKAVGL